jgi:hypothetical protein
VRQAADEDAQRQQQAAQLHAAARRIQLAWLSFNNRRIYRYYRDLIRFRQARSSRQACMVPLLNA